MQPFVDFSSLESVLVLIPKPRPPPKRSARTARDPRRAQGGGGALRGGAGPGLVLRSSTRRSAARPTSSSSTLLSIALLRGSIFGALAGFCAGYLIDTANLGMLGFTSLLLTLAGFWTGRYGETTARDRFHAPFISVAVITVLYGIGTLALRLRPRRARPGRRVPLGAAGDGAPEPDPHLARLRVRAAALPARRRPRPRARGAPPWLAGALAPVPARRPAGRGAVPADAAARAPRRDPRLRRARRLRRALPAPLGPAGALRRQVPDGGEREQRPDDPGRCAARHDRRPQGPDPRRATSSARASRSGPPTCRRPRHAATPSCGRSRRRSRSRCRRSSRRSRRAPPTR